MSIECEYCKKTYSSKSNLTNHQKTAKYCLKIQNEIGLTNNKEKSYDCQYCNKQFSSNQRLTYHLENCLQKFASSIAEIQKLKELITGITAENKLLKEQLSNKNPYIYISELQEKLQELALASIDQKNDLISGMIKKYVKKQPRKQYDEQNVIYILTTSSLQKDRRYILGKAKNLTNRLSTYNKTDEHKVIFYQGCEDEDTMNFLEPLVFKKLKEYREQANRERFILPEDKNIDFFIDTIKNCFEFLK